MNVGDLCNRLGLTFRQLDEETAPKQMMVCRHTEVCWVGDCEHRWPHYPSDEIGTCGEEVCTRAGVLASCVPIDDVLSHQTNS